MKDLIDIHREKISAAATVRDDKIMAATKAFHEATTAYRDATQKAADDYSAAVTASEAALDVQMEQRQAAFFGETPVKEPVIRVTAPQPPMPNVADAPGLAGGAADGDAAGAEGGQG